MTTRILALAAVVLAAGAALATAGGPPEPAIAEGPGARGVEELRAELAGGGAFVDAVTLGEWIRDRRPVRVLDLQDPSANIRFSIPTARHVTRRELSAIERDGPTIVVYDDGSGAAAQAWLLLRRLGHPDVRILRRGVLGWIDGVLEPVLPAGTPDERAAYERVAAVSRYFGGMPRIGEKSSPSTDAMDAVQLLSRRGCY